MIYEMALGITSLMRAKNFPVQLVYGEQIVERGIGAHTAVLLVERDRGGVDALSAPRGAQTNPRRLFTFSVSARATLLVRSGLPGATPGDHERECERFVRGFLCALHRWAAAERAAPVEFLDLGMTDSEDHTQFPGCAYTIRFRVPTGLEDLAYTPEVEHTAGDALPTGTPTGVSLGITTGRLGGSSDGGCGI